MHSRIVRILGLLLILGASIGVMASAVPATAQTHASDNDESCISCHEDLYLLHDTGKWYCLRETKARCTFCHGGVVGALDEQTAHSGMLAKPVQNTETVCKSCHPADYQTRVSTFVTRAGVSASPCPTVSAPFAIASAPATPASETGLAAWQMAALALLGLAFAGLALFAYRCWKADCLLKRTRS